MLPPVGYDAMLLLVRVTLFFPFVHQDRTFYMMSLLLAVS